MTDTSAQSDACSAPKLTVSQKEGQTVHQALSHWQRLDLISDEQAELLKNTIQITTFDWKKAAQYAFGFSIACLLIALSSLLAEDWLITLLTRLFNAPDSGKCVALGVMAAGAFRWGTVRRQTHPEKYFSTEAVFFLGVVFTAMAISFLGNALNLMADHFSWLLLLATLIYGALGLWLSSTLVWLFSLVSLGSWFGAETGYVSGWGAYYLGMNYPLRFVFFGLVLAIAVPRLFTYLPHRAGLARPTRVIGLLYLFIALWILSIFGNYSDLDAWQKSHPSELLHWSLLFGLAAVVCILHGARYDDGITRGFGVTFLLINLYTRYFEYFWNTSHKAVFFGVLGLSFWFLGSHAERLWQIRRPA